MVAGIWNYFWFLRVVGKYLNYYDLLKTVMFHRRTHQSRDDCDWMYLEASSNNLLYITFLYLLVKDNLAPVEFGYNWWWGIWEGSIDLEILECIRMCFFFLFLQDHLLIFFLLFLLYSVTLTENWILSCKICSSYYFFEAIFIFSHFSIYMNLSVTSDSRSLFLVRLNALLSVRLFALITVLGLQRNSNIISVLPI